MNVVPTIKFSTERIFYVYVHRTVDTGRVFYVGKGKNARAWSKRSRNQHWLNTVNKHGGFIVEIVLDQLEEEQAFSLEVELISQYNPQELVNKTLGGVSTTGYRHSNATRQQLSVTAKQRQITHPEYYKQTVQRLVELNHSQDSAFRARAIARARETVSDYTPEERAAYESRRTQWQKDPVRCTIAQQKLQDFWNSVEGQKQKEVFAKALASDWNNPEFAHRVIEAASKQWDNPEFKAKMLTIRSKSVIVNRTLILPSIKSFSDVYNNKSSIVNIIRDAINKGYIGAIINGYLVEYYNPQIHEGNTDAIVHPLPNFELPKILAIKANDLIFLRPQHFAKFIGANNIATTAEWVSKQARAENIAFGYSLSVATPSEVNAEIIKRLHE